MGISRRAQSTQSDSANFSPTNFGTVTTKQFFSTRRGDKLLVHGYYTTGTTVAATADITISTYVIDYSKISNGSGGQIVGYCVATANTDIGSGGAQDVIFVDGSTTNKVFFAFGTTTSVLTKRNGSAVVATGGIVSFYFEIPIVGWS